MRSRAPIVVVLALLTLIGVSFLVYRVLRGTAEARVVVEGNLPELVLTLPGIDDGTHVEVLGRDVVVQGNVGRLVLGDDTLRIGRNDLTVRHEGEEERLSVEVDHWVFRDDATLSLDPPRLGIVVRTSPGRTVSVDGQMIALSPQGEGRFSVAAAADGTAADHTFVIRILGGEEPAELRVRAQAEPATFELVQPPVGFVTDRASLELHLRVDPSATVVLDGTTLALDFGTVRAPLGLSREGDFRFVLDVAQPGKLRRREVLAIRRSPNTALDALSYEVDRSLTYEALVGEGHRGKKLELVGRVFNLRAEEGRTYLQMMAEPCATQSGCPAWIEYPAATLARVGDRVRVRGVFVGPQSYRDATTGTTHSSPHIDAAFLLVGAP